MKKKMVDNFVPAKDRKRLESRIRYNSEADNYYLLREELKPMKRPSFARKDNYRIYTQNGAKLSPMKDVYYSNENILQLAMEIPEWQKKKFIPEVVDPRITAMVTSALEDAKETLKLDCRKLKVSSPNPQKTHLFYSCGQEGLLRQIHLPQRKGHKFSNPPNPAVKYEDFALAENCMGENSSTQCRVTILDESVGKLRGRKPNLGDMYTFPLYVDHNSAFTNDLVIPEEESLDELDDYDEEGLDDLLENLKSIEDLNKISKHAGRKSKYNTSSLDAIPINHSRPKTRGKHGAPKISASTGSIPKNSNMECDANDETCNQQSMASACIPDESGVVPEGCAAWKNHSHRLRPSSATLAFELDPNTCLENPNACRPPAIKQTLINPTEIKILAKKNHNSLACAVSSGKLYSRQICQAASDNRRAIPRFSNQKRDDDEITPPMPLEVYESVRNNSKSKNRNCLDGESPRDSSTYTCGGSDIDEYMQNFCTGTYKYKP